ncbi:MlaD family protein [Nocardia sp. NPDC052001]|uniref:MlaD family protein n=1 Tax=Nocardia sp. NPDC052001 TaxID=3154853 RepID=UPI00342E464A
MRTTRGLIIRLALFGAAMILLLATVLQTVTRPVSGDTDTFTAEFTDASGLFANNDVRLHGVAVGKVRSVELHGGHADVSFTAQRDYPLYTGTTFAIRYESLSGQRYLDIQQPDQQTPLLRSGSRIGTDKTVPSFDITTLFNGLQPVLAELTPGDLNQFAASMLAVINGTSTSIGPALDAIDKLSGYTTDRQAVISTLVRNLGAVATRLNGKSRNTIKSISQLTLIFETLTQRITGLIDFAQIIPPVLEPADHMLATLGLTPGANPDLNTLLRNTLPDPGQVTEVLERLPAVLQSLAALIPGPATGTDTACSHGDAPTPAALAVFIGGQRIKLCNP